jgi:hypothetical protein
MKLIRLKIIELLNKHEGTFDKCKGCPLCTEIKQLRKQLERDPVIKFKYILDKGLDMKRSDLVILLENLVPKKAILKALGITQQEFWEMIKNLGLTTKRRKPNMTKLTAEMYQDYKAQGKSDVWIAKEVGLKQPALSYYKKKWAETNTKPDSVEETHSPCKCSKDDKKSEYEAIINGLKERLEEDDLKIVMLREEKNNLLKKLEELECIHAACEDVENELASVRAELDQERLANEGILPESENEHASITNLEKENKILKDLLRFYL